jgi:hypothetical protein
VQAAQSGCLGDQPGGWERRPRFAGVRHRAAEELLGRYAFLTTHQQEMFTVSTGIGLWLAPCCYAAAESEIRVSGRCPRQPFPQLFFEQVHVQITGCAPSMPRGSPPQWPGSAANSWPFAERSVPPGCAAGSAREIVPAGRCCSGAWGTLTATGNTSRFPPWCPPPTRRSQRASSTSRRSYIHCSSCRQSSSALRDRGSKAFHRART